MEQYIVGGGGWKLPRKLEKGVEEKGKEVWSAWAELLEDRRDHRTATRDAGKRGVVSMG